MTQSTLLCHTIPLYQPVTPATYKINTVCAFRIHVYCKAASYMRVRFYNWYVKQTLCLVKNYSWKSFNLLMFPYCTRNTYCTKTNLPFIYILEQATWCMCGCKNSFIGRNSGCWKKDKQFINILFPPQDLFMNWTNINYHGDQVAYIYLRSYQQQTLAMWLGFWFYFCRTSTVFK